MKKIYICFLLSFFIMLSTCLAVDVRINFGEFNMPEDPIIVNDRTLLPLRVISEIFGCSVNWNPEGIIIVKSEEDTIVLTLNENEILVNGEIKEFDSPPILKNSTTMVPIKFFENYIDAKIEWHETSEIVNIVIENSEILKRAETVSRSYEKRSKYPNAVNKIVVVDPGHGGREAGATYGGIYEKDINLKIANYTKEELERNGVRVYMTRTGDTTTSLSSRTTLANNLNADLFVSVHNNAMTNKSSIKGTEVLYPTSTIVKNGITSYSLASHLQNVVSSEAGTYNKGIINRNNLYVLNHTNMPAVIVEVAYMTNSSDLKKLKNAKFLEKAGKAIAKGVLESF